MIPLLTSPPEPAVPPGRLTWSRGPKASIWTLQTLPVWRTLEATGRYVLPSDEFLPSDFADAYTWMRRRLIDRFDWDLDGRWPIWGWARILRRELIPNWDGEVGQVLMKLEVPRELVVASNFDGWHSVLNNGTLYPPTLSDDEGAFDRWDESDSKLVHDLGGRPGVVVSQWPREAREHAERSWETIFDVEAWSRRHPLQCVMPCLEASWVVRAVRIDALEVRRRIFK